MKNNVLKFSQFVRIYEDEMASPEMDSSAAVSATSSSLTATNSSGLGLETAKSLSSKIQSLFNSESFWAEYKGEPSVWNLIGDDDEPGAFTAFQTWWNKNIAPYLNTRSMHQDYVTLLSTLLGEIKTKMLSFTTDDSLTWTIGTSTYTIDTDF